MKTKPAQNVQQVDDNAVKEVVKRKNQKLSDFKSIHTEPGDNTKYLNHSLMLMDLKKPNMRSVEEVAERIRLYFSLCAENDMKPSIEGLALAFSVDRRTLWKWVNGIDSAMMPGEVREAIKKAYIVLNDLMAQYMQNGKINPVSGIFLMKNNMGYTDQTEIVVTPNSPLGEVRNPDEIEKRITDGVIVETIQDD